MTRGRAVQSRTHNRDAQLETCSKLRFQPVTGSLVVEVAALLLPSSEDEEEEEEEVAEVNWVVEIWDGVRRYSGRSGVGAAMYRLGRA